MMRINRIAIAAVAGLALVGLIFSGPVIRHDTAV